MGKSTRNGEDFCFLEDVGYFSALSSANRRQSSGLGDTSLRATTRGLGQFVVSGKPHCLVSFGPRPFHVPPKT